MPKHTVYISHAHTDNNVCDLYVAALRARGFDIWYDRTNLQVGMSASAEIERQLEARSAFVALLSESAVSSYWVQIETSAYMSLLARDHSRIFLPVRISPCDFPPLMRNHSWLDATTMPFEQVIDRLASALGESDKVTLPLPLDAKSDAQSNKPAPRVFVSHSHKDNDFAMKLVRDLREAGVSVWVDVANVRHGNFIDIINNALLECDWFVLIQSPNALHSKAVRMETNCALNLVLQDRIRDVIPIMAAECDPLEVPPMWSALHYYDATRDYVGALTGLLRALDA